MTCSAGVPPAVARASCPRRSAGRRRGAQMKPKYFKTLAVVLVLAVVAAIAVSQGMRRAHMRGDGMFGGPMMGYYIHKLDLTDAQQAQVKAIMAKEKPTLPAADAADGPGPRAVAGTGHERQLRRSESPRTGFAAEPDHDRTHGAVRPHRLGDGAGPDSGSENKTGRSHQCSTSSGS